MDEKLRQWLEKTLKITTPLAQAETMRTSDIGWTLSNADLLKNGTGHVNIPVGASAQGFNAFEQIGRVGGTFQGDVMQTQTGYKAVGAFTPKQDTYDFNLDPSRGFLANAAAAVGGWVGYNAFMDSYGIIVPTDYKINFVGSVPVNQSWP